MQATTSVEKNRRLSENVKRSKVFWCVPFAIMAAVILISKAFHVQMPFVHLDLGTTAICVMIVGCLAAITYYSSVNATTTRLLTNSCYASVEPRLQSGLFWHRLIGPLSQEHIRDLIDLVRVSRELRKFDQAREYAEQALTVIEQRENQAVPTASATKNEELLRLAQMSTKGDCLLSRAQVIFELGACDYIRRKRADAARQLKQSADLCEQLFAECEQALSSPQPKASGTSEQTLAVFNIRSAAQQMLAALETASAAYELTERIHAETESTEAQADVSVRRERLAKRGLRLVDQGLISDEWTRKRLRLLCLCYMKDYATLIPELDALLSDRNLSPILARPLYIMRGESHNRLGHLDAAVADATRALEFDPNCATALFNRAEVYRKQRRHDLAQSDLDRAAHLGAQLPQLTVDG